MNKFTTILGGVLAAAAPALEVALEKGLVNGNSKGLAWAAVAIAFLGGFHATVTSAPSPAALIAPAA